MKGLRVFGMGCGVWFLFPAALLLMLLVLAGCGTGPTTSTSVITPGSTTTASVDNTGSTEATDTTDTTGATGATDTTVVEATTTTAGIVIDLPTTTTSLATTGTTQVLSTAETLLANGHVKAMGFIDKVYVSGGKRYIRIDYAEMLTGTKAVKAAAADGVSLDGDYYIRNSSHTKRTFEVSATVPITTSTRWVSGEQMGASCTWTDFKSFWGSASGLDDSEKHLHSVPWWIERSGQVVVKIDEQYLP